MQERLPVSNTLPADALKQAGNWWNKYGRQKVKEEFTLEFSSDPTNDLYHPSGIMRSEPWGKLTQMERFAVTKHWHHEHFVVPATEPKKTPIAQAINEIIH